MALFKRKQKLLGIDMGSESIKAVEIQMTSLGYQINNFSMIALPRDMVNGQGINDSLALTNAVRMAVLSLGKAKPKAATAVKEQSVFLDYLDLPLMTNKELAEAISYEIAPKLPWPLEDTQIDFAKIGETIKDDILKQKIMVVAIKKEKVNKRLEVLRNAGVSPVVMDLEALAIHRMAKEIAKINGNSGAYIFINMGFAYTNISIFVDDVLNYTHTIPMGGDNLTQAISEFFKISYAEAEKTKKLIDLTGEFQEHGVNILLHQKVDVILPVLEIMTQEIKDCLKIFQGQNPQSNLEMCYLVGGCSLFKGLEQFLEHELMLKVQVINPASFLALPPHLESREKELYEVGPTLAVAIGLALSEV